MDARVELSSDRGATRAMPCIGVIRVVPEANELALVDGHSDRSNLGPRP